MNRMEKNQIVESSHVRIDKNKSTDKNKMQIVLAAGIGALLFAVTGLGYAWAETEPASSSDIQIKATDAIKQDPTAMGILYKIEQFKQNYAAMQQRQQVIDQQQQYIEQQRKIANELLQADLANMHNANTLNTAHSAYAGFVNTVDDSEKNLFWDQFQYTQNKVMQAKLAMSSVLQNGGTMQDALQAYNNAAATHKSELVSVNTKLNIDYNFTDAKTQNKFDSLGNLRT